MPLLMPRGPWAARRPTEAAAATICDQLSGSIGMPLASRSRRVRSSISPGRSTEPPGSSGGEALVQAIEPLDIGAEEIGAAEGRRIEHDRQHVVDQATGGRRRRDGC